jgi:HPt (histidine-containing phosphotransfer) domain-containing protein
MYRISGMADTVGKPFTAQELWRCLVKYIPVEGFTAVDSVSLSSEEETMQKKLKINFVKTNQNTFNEFTKALNENDGKLAHRLAHTLKSNAGQIGEKRLQASADAVETILNEGLGSITKRHIHDLETELKIVLDRLAPLLMETKAEKNIEPLDNEKILNILDQLEPLLDNMDTDCLNIIEDLQGMPEAQELIDQIEGYEYETALLTLENMRKELVAEHD